MLPSYRENKFQTLRTRSSASLVKRPVASSRRIRSHATDKSTAADKGSAILEWANKVAPQGLFVKVVKEGWRLVWTLMLKELAPKSSKGGYVREAAQFQLASGGLVADPGRYHLYLGNACPWCHRCRLVISLLGLESLVTITLMGSDPTVARRGGWIFTPEAKDPVLNAADLWEVYDSLSPGYRGRCTAPLLIDVKERRIVSNESSDIVAALNAVRGQGTIDLLPSEKEAEIKSLCSEIYSDINNMVYEAGFATTQLVYNETQRTLFNALDRMDAKLSTSKFLLGTSNPTMADVYLFPTIIRFDAIYSGLFKCSKKRVTDYPNLLRWTKDLWGIEKIRETVDLDAAVSSYYTSLFPLSPGGIVPSGPRLSDLKLDQE